MWTEMGQKLTDVLTKDLRFTLRRAVPDDAGLVLEFMQKLGAYQQMSEHITATEASLRALLTDGAGEAVFGLYDGVAKGFIFFNETASAFTGRSGLFIDGFYVDDVVRHGGLGKIMMGFMANEAIARGCQMLEWGCLDWNAPTISFYQGLGAYCLDTMRIYRLAPDRLQMLADTF